MKLWDTLLLIGDHNSDRPYLRQIFQDSYNLLEANSIEQGLFLLEHNRSCIATVIVDRPPPRSNDDSFLQEASLRGLIGDIPMLVIITPSGSGQLEELAFSLGASDVVPRPYTEAVIRRRIQIMVDLYRNSQHLLDVLAAQTEAIRHTNEVMVDALSSIIEYRSTESGSHILRIRRFTEILLTEVARSCPEYGLTRDNISNIASAAALHDIGKISIPDIILNKPGRLTAQERDVMRTHTTNGSRMIEALSGATSEEYLRYAYNICRYHHERWDGSGYPDGLKGEEIPICAQVVGLADAFDALTSHRVYKPAYPASAAANAVLNGECGEFSPKLLECFKHVCQQFIDLAQSYADGRSPKSDSITLPLPDPVYQNHEMGSLQMAQLKYQTILHYTEATVIEMDLNRNTYHIVYNPIPDFRPLPADFTLTAALESITNHHVHPDEMDMVQEKCRFLLGDFVTRGLRRHSFSCRIYSPLRSSYILHQITFLRLETGNPDERKVLMLWSPAPSTPVDRAEEPVIPETKALANLMGGLICRLNDRWYTIASGSGSLMDLLGYSKSEIEQLFHGHFLDLVLEEDREPLRRAVAEQLLTSTQTEVEYRVRHKDGHILWILEKGCIITGGDGQEYFCGTLMDNSRSHIMESRLQDTMERYRIINDLTDNIIFEWDILRQTIQISPQWKDHFGYEPYSLQVVDNTLRSSRIHPDDLPAVRSVATAVLAGEHNQEADLRIANAEGKYIWCRVRLSAQVDAQGTPFRAVGVIRNIDSSKRINLALQEQAQRDSLTGLLNKASAQNSIKKYLESPEHSGSSALLIIDLDNFKGVNDRFGHLFGDTVLTRTAHTIRRMFRGGDIIGRVGGDEFLVLMKDVSSEELVRDRCTLLMQALQEVFQSDSADCPVSCSAGVSLSPEHGTSFQELFQRADQALYHSKQSGKNCCTIYQSSLELALEQFSASATPIDSNEQPAMSTSNLVRAVFHQLSHSKDLERTIEEVLAMVGELTNVSRVYIFENNEENTHCSNTFEWCNEGIPPQKDFLQDICYETDIPGWESNYDENGLLFWTDISKVRQEYRDILEPQGVKSMLHCAIRENGVFRGYVGLDECSSNRVWTQDLIDILAFLAEVVVSFLLKKRTQDKTDAMFANLRSILDSQNNWVYVIDPDSFRLRYINENTIQAIPTLKLGDVCYRAIMQRDTPCENCPMKKQESGRPASSVIVSRSLGIPVVAEAASISWNGSKACLLTCRKQD